MSPAKRLRRAPVVRIYDVLDTTVIVAPGGQVHELAGPSAALARAVLDHCLAPRTRAEIIAHIEALSGGPVPDTSVVDQLLVLLEGAQVLIAAPSPEHASPVQRRSQPRIRLVLGLCGAVAASLAPSLVTLLQRRGFEIELIATESALRFVSAEALGALVHGPVPTSMWPSSPDRPVPHINLAQWADVVLVWPATATTIARLAAGDHSQLVAAVALTTRAPVVLVPSMNADMFAEPAVQRNLAQLVADGVHVAHPGSGAELAQAPGERVAGLGPTPPHAVVATVVETVLRLAHARTPPRPRDAASWDALFRTRSEDELDWHRDELDPDLHAVLAREVRPGKRLLELGTGLGVGALAAAKLGYQVLATDLSETALARARERTDDPSIVWLRDDVRASNLASVFDVILDRGCLHLLDPAGARAYAETLARLSAPGSLVVIKTHDPSEGASRGTTPYDAGSLSELLGPRFVLESEAPSTLPGPRAEPAARLFVLRRQA